jgi:hypothetical protein
MALQHSKHRLIQCGLWSSKWFSQRPLETGKQREEWMVTYFNRWLPELVMLRLWRRWWCWGYDDDDGDVEVMMTTMVMLRLWWRRWNLEITINVMQMGPWKQSCSTFLHRPFHALHCTDPAFCTDSLLTLYRTRWNTHYLGIWTTTLKTHKDLFISKHLNLLGFSLCRST